MKNTMRKIVAASALCLFSSMALAEVAVIVHPSNNATISKDVIQDIYMAKAKSFPGGKSVKAYDQKEGSAVRVEFVTKVIEKDEQQIKSYWSRLIFTGKGVPPEVKGSDAEVRDAVAKDPSGIGFIDVSSVNDKVKVISTF